MTELIMFGPFFMTDYDELTPVVMNKKFRFNLRTVLNLVFLQLSEL